MKRGSRQVHYDKDTKFESTSGTSDGQQNCPVTGLTDPEKEVLMATWREVIGTTLDTQRMAAVNLMLWMFENVPDMTGTFKKFSAAGPPEVLAADPAFVSHSLTVFYKLDMIIRSLHNRQSLSKQMKDVVRLHMAMNPPIGIKYFGPLHNSFHEFLEIYLDLSPDREELRLWSIFWESWCDMVKQAEIKRRKKSLPEEMVHSCCCVL